MARTSAQDLMELLIRVTKAGKKDERFIDVVMSTLGVSGERAKTEVITRLYLLASDVREDVELAGLDGTEKALAANVLSKIGGILSLSQITQPLETLQKGHFLAADCTQDLYALHMALEPRVPRTEFSNHLVGLTKELEEFTQEVLKNDCLPEELQTLIVERLNQMRTAIQYASIWNVGGIDDAMEKLAGSIAIARAATGDSEDQRGFWNRAGGVVMSIFKGANSAKKFSGDVVGTLENAESITKLIDAVK